MSPFHPSQESPMMHVPTTTALLNVADRDMFVDFVKDVTHDGASDIAFSPSEPPHYKLNGRWECSQEHSRLREQDLYTIIALTHPSLREHQQIRDILLDQGRLSYSTDIDDSRYRVQTGLTHGEPFLVLRPIPQHVPSIEELELLPTFKLQDGTPVDLENTLKNIATNSSGLVIVTGATGSGKTTTLAAIIRHFNDTRQGHIITIEDPIEFVHRKNKSLVHQRMVGPLSDVPTFDAGVEDALRQAPDIILIGEVRDKATMTAALAAAETGHLVFITLHTRDAASTIQRVLGFYGAGEKENVRTQFANSLKAIISQVLIPRIHPSPRGKTRQLIAEILQPDNGMRSAMRDPNKPLQSIRDGQKSSAEIGNVTLDDELFRATKLAIIERNEALSRAVDRSALSERFKNERIGGSEA